MRIEAERALSSGTGISGVSQPSSQPYVLSHGAYEPEFTNYTQTYVGCLDYIFFDDRYLKLTGTLDLLKEVTLMEVSVRRHCQNRYSRKLIRCNCVIGHCHLLNDLRTTCLC